MTPKRHAEMDAPANPATGAAAQSTTFSSSSQQPLQRAGGLSQQRWESITRGLAARSRVPITSELPAPVAEEAVDRTAHDPIPESRLDRPSGMASLRPVLAAWLLLPSSVLAGLGQWQLGQEQDRSGLFFYLAGVVAFLVVLLATRVDFLPPQPEGSWPFQRTTWLSLVIAGQVTAFVLARPEHLLWPVFIPWALSLVAGVACLAPVPNRAIRWQLPTGLLRRMLPGGLLLVAAVVRLVNLEGIPSGIHGDEGEFGTIALDILHGRGPSPFGTAFLGDPALYPHLLAPFVAIFGVNMTAIRLLSALAGTATVAIFYLFIRDLCGNRASLIAATLLACSAPHIHFSRMALNVIEAPLFACLGLWFLWKGLTTQRAVWYLLAGIAGGLGWYFHFSARIVAPVLAVVLLWQCLARQTSLVQTIRGTALTAMGGLLSLTPLLSHTLTTPGDLDSHVNMRLIWNAWAETAQNQHTTPDDWRGILIGQTYATLTAFVQHSDVGVFFPFSSSTLVSVLVAPFVVLGFVALLTRPRSLPTILLVSWFLVPFFCGSVLIVEPGAFHRLLIALPAALAIGSLFLDRSIALLIRSLPAHFASVPAICLLLVAPWAGLQDVQRYFGPDVAAYPLSDITAQARALQALPPGTVAYVMSAPTILADHGASRYLGQAIERHDLLNPTVTLPKLGGQPFVVLADGTNREWLPLLHAYYPQGHMEEVRWPNGQIVLYKFTVSPGSEPAIVPTAGLRGEIRPVGDAPVVSRHDPALAFIRLADVANSPEFTGDWEGRLRPPGPGDYQLEVVTDGAITLSLNGVPVITDPAITPDVRTLTGAVSFAAGEDYDVQLQGHWMNNGGYLALYWRKADDERELVPPAAFFALP
jgi:hypothetical protein